MKNYDIVTEYKLYELIDTVNDYIEKGYIPIGEAIIDGGLYRQTMFNPNAKIERVDI